MKELEKRRILKVVSFFLICFAPLFFVGTAGAFQVDYLNDRYQAEEFLTLPFPTAAIEFDSEGNLYTTDAREFSTEEVNILKLDALSGYSASSTYASYSTTMRGVNGLDFDDSGNLFASEFEYPGDSGLIRWIDKHLTVSDPIVFADFRPTGIAAIEDGIVYFPGRKWTVEEFGNIYTMDVFEDSEPTIVKPDKVATAIAIDDSGNIFLAFRDGSVWTRNPYTDVSFWIATFSDYVEELNFDAEGNLYALEANNEGNETATIIKIIPPHVLIDGCDTGIVEWALDDESTITEKIEDCAAGARNHGAFVRCVAKLTNELRKSGIITGKEKGAIQRCAAKADIP